LTARVRLAALLMAATACLAGCGGSSPEKPASEPVPIEGVGASIGGSVAPLAQCRDWVRGSVDERMATIEDIRGQLTPQTAQNEDSGFPDQEAYDLFQRVCAQKYAAAFRLYKVYTQRAGFEPLVP
jgi:ABC-type glycerol-3-phosphate transport system substrate-binding protein